MTFFSRPGCHLCDEALAELNGFLSGSDFEATVHPEVTVEVIDIESDDDLHRRYLERIPVIMVNDQIVSELAFEPDALVSVLSD